MPFRAKLIGAPSGLGFAVEWYRQLLMSSKVFGFIAVIIVVNLPVVNNGLRSVVVGAFGIIAGWFNLF